MGAEAAGSLSPSLPGFRAFLLTRPEGQKLTGTGRGGSTGSGTTGICVDGPEVDIFEIHQWKSLQTFCQTNLYVCPLSCLGYSFDFLSSSFQPQCLHCGKSFTVVLMSS